MYFRDLMENKNKKQNKRCNKIIVQTKYINKL